jgi:hypothetical protein
MTTFEGLSRQIIGFVKSPSSGGCRLNLWGHLAPQVLMKLVEFYCSLYGLGPPCLLAGPTGFDCWIRHCHRHVYTILLERKSTWTLKILQRQPKKQRQRSPKQPRLRNPIRNANYRSFIAVSIMHFNKSFRWQIWLPMVIFGVVLLVVAIVLAAWDMQYFLLHSYSVELTEACYLWKWLLLLWL